MKEIKSLSELQDAINRNDSFHQDVNGKIYDISIVILLSMKLLDVIVMIKEKRLKHTINY